MTPLPGRGCEIVGRTKSPVWAGAKRCRMLERMSSTIRTLLIAGVGTFAAVVASTACGLDLVGRASVTTDELDAGGPQTDAGGDDDPDDDTDSSIPVDADAPADAGEDVTLDAGNDAGDPYTTRVTADLVALYDFEEGIGTVIRDQTAAPLDLTLNSEARAKWGPHVLVITNYNVLSSSASFDKGRLAMEKSAEFSLEAWVEYTGQSSEYGRIVEASSNTDDRNFTLGTRNGRPWTSLRSSESAEATTRLDGALHHIVSTRNAARELRLYVDGVLVSGPITTQPFDNWSDRKLFVANTATYNRGWTGTFHLVAIYSRALSATDVLQNFQAGADPR